MLSDHIGRATAGQVYHGVGSLFDSWQECRKRCGALVWFTSLQIAGV